VQGNLFNSFSHFAVTNQGNTHIQVCLVVFNVTVQS
jgi:hypothetical protein